MLSALYTPLQEGINAIARKGKQMKDEPMTKPINKRERLLKAINDARHNALRALFAMPKDMDDYVNARQAERRAQSELANLDGGTSQCQA